MLIVHSQLSHVSVETLGSKWCALIKTFQYMESVLDGYTNILTDTHTAAG